MKRSYTARVVAVPQDLLGPPITGPMRVYDAWHGAVLLDWALLDEGRLLFEVDQAFIFRVGQQVHLRDGGRILAVGIVTGVP